MPEQKNQFCLFPFFFRGTKAMQKAAVVFSLLVTSPAGRDLCYKGV
jgi:hypothetical protein